MAPSSSSSNTTRPPPPSAAKRSFLRRILPVLLVTNVAFGVYLFIRTSKKEPSQKDGEATEKVPSVPAEKTTSISVTEKTSSAESSAPVTVLPPIPENEQRELFKWILEEKRKTKPGNKEEKKKLDEEKAILKEFIHAKSIPNF